MTSWNGRTVVAIASGTSLTKADCELVRASGLPTIVTNTTFRLCPWADALFAFDLKWWAEYHEEVGSVFHGKRLSASMVATKYGAEWVYGPARYRQYRNSGACAAGWAMDQGSAKVVLLGCDAMRGPNGETHHHGSHPDELRDASSASEWVAQFALLAKDAEKRGVEIVNASRRTALRCFRRVALEDAI